MSSASERICLLGALVLVAMATCVRASKVANADDDNNNMVEIKTEPPPPPNGLHNDYKDCNEFFLGKLQAVRGHGTTWQKQDCSNCTCQNGQIRCFVHFCNAGPSTGFITPPSTTEKDSLYDLTGDTYDDEELSSGFQPELQDLDPDDDWPPPPPPSWEHSSRDETKVEQHRDSTTGQDRQENETYNPHPDLFCGKICKKTCPNGFKIDRMTLCYKCRCLKCPPMTNCLKKCPKGFLHDDSGCMKCACISNGTKYTDEDIVFDDAPKSENPLRKSIESLKEEEERIIQKEIQLLSDGDDDDANLDSTDEEPCNTTTNDNPNSIDWNRFSKNDWMETENNKNDYVIPSAGEIKQKQRQSNTENSRPAAVNHFIDDTTVKTAVKDDHSQLLMILVPMGVIFTLGILLLTHFWRRYHRDKYDINSCRPEEKETLRPVKTLQDDQSSLGHV